MAEEAGRGAVLVIGVGCRERGDDAVGPRVVDLLRELATPGLALRCDIADGAALVEAWQGFDRVVVIDAVRSASSVGSIHRIDALRDPLPQPISPASTHGFGLAEAVELARVLGQLPRELTLYGIEAEHFDLGRPMSAPVAESAAQLATHLAPSATQEEGTLLPL